MGTLYYQSTMEGVHENVFEERNEIKERIEMLKFEVQEQLDRVNIISNDVQEEKETHLNFHLDRLRRILLDSVKVLSGKSRNLHLHFDDSDMSALSRFITEIRSYQFFEKIPNEQYTTLFMEYNQLDRKVYELVNQDLSSVCIITTEA